MYGHTKSRSTNQAALSMATETSFTHSFYFLYSINLFMHVSSIIILKFSCNYLANFDKLKFKIAINYMTN